MNKIGKNTDPMPPGGYPQEGREHKHAYQYQHKTHSKGGKSSSSSLVREQKLEAGVLEKLWKIVQRQLVDSHQRRAYFEKNSVEDVKIKKLLRENEKIKVNREGKTRLLYNLEEILDICFDKLSQNMGV